MIQMYTCLCINFKSFFSFRINRYLEFEKDSIVKLISMKVSPFLSRDLFLESLKESYFPGNHDNRVDRSENVAQLKLFDGNL